MMIDRIIDNYFRSTAKSHKQGHMEGEGVGGEPHQTGDMHMSVGTLVHRVFELALGKNYS